LNLAKNFTDNNKKRQNPSALINENVEFQKVRLVGADGVVVGIVSIEDAMAVAEESGLDLVVVSEDSDPPVCKILDYGKYKYEMQ
jgi:translation initiation factor IF-3